MLLQQYSFKYILILAVSRPKKVNSFTVVMYGTEFTDCGVKQKRMMKEKRQRPLSMCIYFSSASFLLGG